ncbi:MAG: integrase family protein, partial [Nitrospinota bacterium]|nr:integrase family protein [Nitrospinota bacterium]
MVSPNRMFNNGTVTHTLPKKMISNNKLKLTKSTIDKIPFSTNRQCHYWDANIIGFGLRVGKGKKVFIVLRRINGKLVKRTIGSYGVFTPDQARVRAQELLLGMAMGKDPKVEEDRLKIRKITLGEAFNSYMEIRKSMKPRTIHSYEWMFNRYFGDWADKNLELITTEMVIKRHTEIGASSAGEAQANYAMRILRAVINFAMRRFKTADGIPVFLVNPVVSGLSDLKGWYRDKRKTRLLKREELPDFYKAVIDLKENSISTRANVLRDYFLLILLSGFRKLEAARIKLVDLNFTSKTFTAWDTKNSEAHTLPMSDYLFKLFKRRYENRVAGNPYVFPGNDGGHITEYRKQF